MPRFGLPCRVRRHRIVAALALFAAPAFTQSLLAETETETVTLEPAGRVTWSDLLAEQAVRDSRLGPQRRYEPKKATPAEGEHNVGEEQGFALEQEINLQRRKFIPKQTNSFDDSPLRMGAQSYGVLTLDVEESFEALSDNNTSIPPDTMGAVGPNHLMTMLNTEVGVQTRDSAQVTRVSLSTFWTGGTGITGLPRDPRLLFDTLADRWIATAVADSQSATSSVFFAISDTDDPTGVWTFYEIDSDPADAIWTDFPNMGLNDKWIAITGNMFSVGPNDFAGAKMWVVDKSTALAGGALTITVFDVGFDLAGGFTSFSLVPCQTFDPNQFDLFILDRPGLTSNDVQLLRLSRIRGATGDSPTWEVLDGQFSQFTGLYMVNNDFSPFLIDGPQLGAPGLIDSGKPDILNAIFRNGHIWATHGGALPEPGIADRTAVFWYQIKPLRDLPFIQSGSIDGGPGTHYMFPSIAANSFNDMCIAFSSVDATRHVEAVYSGRLVNDPPNTTRPVTTIKAGEDPYEKTFGGSRIRWGDYSATVVDPRDDVSFWTIQQYAAADVGATANDDRWGTWWARIGDVELCPSDITGDGITDGSDLATLLAEWGSTPVSADFTGDNEVSGADLAVMLAGWGFCAVVNDDMANALPITDGDIEFVTNAATTDGPNDCANMGADIWYCYTAPCAGQATFSLAGSDFDTALSLYDGCDNTDTLLACNDDFGGPQSQATVSVFAGQKILVRVGGASGAVGAGTLSVTCDSNDSCEFAQEIGLGVTAFDSRNATTDGPALPPACDEGGGLFFEVDVWYLHTPTATGTLVVSTCDQTDFDTRLAAYTGDCGSLTLIACNDDGPGCSLFTSIMEVPVTAGVPIRIRLGAFGVDAGVGTLTLSMQP